MHPLRESSGILSLTHTHTHTHTICCEETYLFFSFFSKQMLESSSVGLQLALLYFPLLTPTDRAKEFSFLHRPEPANLQVHGYVQYILMQFRLYWVGVVGWLFFFWGGMISCSDAGNWKSTETISIEHAAIGLQLTAFMAQPALFLITCKYCIIYTHMIFILYRVGDCLH